MSGIYWGLGAMDVLNSLEEMNREKVIEFVVACQHPNGIALNSSYYLPPTIDCL